MVKTIALVLLLFPFLSPRVDLFMFKAHLNYKWITVEWVTTREAENEGFNIYGQRTAESPRQKLNTSLIPSQKHDWAHYYFFDGIGHFQYWLQSVDAAGHVQWFGPVRPTTEQRGSFGLRR